MKLKACLRGAAGVLAAALTCGAIFFALLSLWGVLFAPWVRLTSASFVIIVAWVLATALTVLIFRVRRTTTKSQPRKHRAPRDP